MKGQIFWMRPMAWVTRCLPSTTRQSLCNSNSLDDIHMKGKFQFLFSLNAAKRCCLGQSSGFEFALGLLATSWYSTSRKRKFSSFLWRATETETEAAAAARLGDGLLPASRLPLSNDVATNHGVGDKGCQTLAICQSKDHFPLQTTSTTASPYPSRWTRITKMPRIIF